MMGAGGITNVGPINTPTTGKGAIMGFDPIMKLHKRAVKKRKKMESAGKQWEHRKKDPTYIDGRSKQARKLIKRLSKKKKMAEAVIREEEEKKSGDFGIDVTLLPWIILSQDSQMIIPVDSVLTVDEPLDSVTQLYQDKVNSFEIEETND